MPTATTNANAKHGAISTRKQPCALLQYVTSLTSAEHNPQIPPRRPKKVPQLFVSTGATKWNDPQHFPWTMGWQPNYQSEGRIYAEYLMKNHPRGKIAILYQNDDYGKDYVKGIKDGLAGKMMIVAELPYEAADPT